MNTICMYPNSSYPRDLITLLFWQENFKISKGLSVFWVRRSLVEPLQKLMSSSSRHRIHDDYLSY